MGMLWGFGCERRVVHVSQLGDTPLYPVHFPGMVALTIPMYPDNSNSKQTRKRDAQDSH